MNKRLLRDRFRGCLVGGAAGDALGYPVEFQHETEIRSRYGAFGITGYDLFKGFDKALVTDDTQMALFTAGGLLRCAALRQSGEPLPEQECIRRAYLDWLFTQQNEFAPHPFRKVQGGDLPERDGHFVPRLMEERWLYARRAPGNTCLTALESGGQGSFSAPLNNSKGCGGIMRTAPAGLYAASPEEAMLLGAEAAVLTHGHPLGYMPAGVLSYLVYGAAKTDQPLDTVTAHALDAADRLFEKIPAAKPYLPALRNLTERALRFAADDTCTDHEAIAALGEGWVGEEALAVALYCALRYQDDFDGCLIAAVNHDGDSDSTGAIAGNILGARLGLSGIPAAFTASLEGVPLLCETADALLALE